VNQAAAGVALKLDSASARCARRRSERIHAVDAPQNNKEKSQRGAPLSPREIEVVRLIAEGLCTKQVAAEMKISIRTVKFFLTRVFAKTGTGNQRGLLLWWLKARGAPSRDPSRLRDCLDRIEGELEILSSAVRDRSEKLEIGAAASARDCVAQIERAFGSVKRFRRMLS
jgi:DNA-binding CsgD family transcriptional regulator